MLLCMKVQFVHIVDFHATHAMSSAGPTHTMVSADPTHTMVSKGSTHTMASYP